LRAEGRSPVVRLRMPDEDITWHDLVRGRTTFGAGTVPDFALTRASGDPLYTLVNPVDDALMKITHVLRGEDILPSTPRQIALYQALIRLGVAERVPEFAHLPSVLGDGNKKLSKRDPESNLFAHRDRGSASPRWWPRSMWSTSTPTPPGSTRGRPMRSMPNTSAC
jgi:glutamyl-tRNA synthetase